MRRRRLLTCLLIALALTAVTVAYAIKRTVIYRGAIAAHTNLHKARSQDTSPRDFVRIHIDECGLTEVSLEMEPCSTFEPILRFLGPSAVRISLM